MAINNHIYIDNDLILCYNGIVEKGIIIMCVLYKCFWLLLLLSDRSLYKMQSLYNENYNNNSHDSNSPDNNSYNNPFRNTDQEVRDILVGNLSNDVIRSIEEISKVLNSVKEEEE